MSGWANPTQPNIADYTLFLRGIGVTTAALPDDSPWIGYAFDQAALLVNPYGQFLQCGLPGIANTTFTLAVYNLGAHLQIMITPDQPGQTVFADLRKAYNLLGFVAGTVQASSDQGTSQSLLAPDFLSQLSMRDLNYILTPWGRAYLAYAQDYGEIVGVS